MSAQIVIPVLEVVILQKQGQRMAEEKSAAVECVLCFTHRAALQLAEEGTHLERASSAGARPRRQQASPSNIPTVIRVVASMKLHKNSQYARVGNP